MGRRNQRFPKSIAQPLRQLVENLTQVTQDARPCSPTPACDLLAEGSLRFIQVFQVCDGAKVAHAVMQTLSLFGGKAGLWLGRDWLAA